MHCTRVILRVILLRDFLPGALHPRRRTRGGRLVIRRRRLLGLSTGAGGRLDLLIGPTHAAERIVLTDQPRQFGQRIALAFGVRLLVLGAIRVILGGGTLNPFTTNHPNKASHPGKPAHPPLSKTAPPRAPPPAPSR